MPEKMDYTVPTELRRDLSFPTNEDFGNLMGQVLGCVKVKESNVAIKEAFGKFDGVLQPGCHYVPWYLGKRVAATVSVRVKQLIVLCETKTKDNKFATVVASVQYRTLAEKAANAHYKLTNPTSQLQAYVYDAIRATVTKMDLDSVFEKKNEIARAIEEELAKAMSDYGYEIVQTHILNIKLDEKLKEAMKAAEAEKISKIKRAEGEAESKYLAGVGIGRQRQAIVDGMRGDSVLAFSENVPGASSKDITDMILVTQYLDTMKETGTPVKPKAVLTPNGPGAAKEIASQIKAGLQGTAVTLA